MSVRASPGCACVVLLSLATHTPAAGEDFPSALRAYLQLRVQARGTPGGIVVGTVDEQGSRVVGYGPLDGGTGREVDGDTLFEIGSVTKSFTTLLLQDMVRRGQMRLDDPVAKYLPGSVTMPTRGGKEITLRHLATHTSGLPRIPDNLDPQRADNPYADYTVERMYAFLSRHPLGRDPGAKSEYSNLGMGLLGHVIALKAGASYPSLVTQRICRPLKMDSTCVVPGPALKARFVTPHNAFGEPVPSWDLPTLTGAGGLRSTANDLLTFVSANLGLTPSGLTPLMRETHDLGLAWVTTPGRDGSRVIWYSGGTLGCAAFVGFDPARRRGAVVLTNSSGGDVGALGRYLLACEWRADRRPAASLSSGAPDSYVGRYRHAPDGSRGVRKGALYLVAGCWVAAQVVLSRRASGTAARWLFAGGAVLVGCLVAGHIALTWRGVSGASSTPEVGIRHDGDRLFVQLIDAGSPPVDDLWPPVVGELVPGPDGRSVERLSGTPITFRRDPRGGVTGFLAHHHSTAMAFEKTSDQPPEAPVRIKPRAVVRLDTRLLDACVGRYEFLPYGAFRGMKMAVRREGEQLLCQAWGEDVLQGAIDLLPQSETTFILKINGAQLIFAKNDKGEVTAVTHRLAGYPDIEGRKRND